MVHRPIKIAETVLFWQLLFRHLGLRWGARQFSSKDEIPSKSRLEYLATEIQPWFRFSFARRYVAARVRV